MDPAAAGVDPRLAIHTGGARWRLLDPRRITAPYPLLPLVVLMGLATMAQLDGLAVLLLLPAIKDTFGGGLFFVSTVAVAGIQVGLLVDVPVAALANRLRRMRFLCIGMAVVATFSVLAAVAGFGGSVVLLDVAVAGVAVAGWAFTSTQNSLLADYYPTEIRSRVFFAHRAAIAGGLALGPAIVGALELFYDWQVPFLVLAAPTLFFATVGLFLREPAGARSAESPSDPAFAEDHADPATFAEATRVLFANRSVRRIYYSLPFLAVAVIGVQHFADLLYRNVFHQGASQRALILAVVQPGAFIGLVLGFVVVQRLMTNDPGRAVRWISFVAVGAAVCLAALALAPNLAWAVGAHVAYLFVSSWLLAAIFATIALASPPRLVTLAFALTSLWFGFGVGVVAPVGPSLVSNVNGAFGFRAGFFVIVALYLVGWRLLASSGRFLDADLERVRITALADAEVRRARVEGRAKLLMVRALDAGYDGLQVLFGVDFDVDDGEMVAILGTNGAGKTTLLRAISGLTTPTAGEVFFDGRDITSLDASRIVDRGIVQVPGGRGIFADLTVAESLHVSGWRYTKDPEYLQQATEAVLAYFPVLQDRWHTPAGSLSGGEQQMLSLAQAFIARPRLLMIDELSLGLAPVVIEALREIVQSIHHNGTTVILVEQSVNLALRLTDRAIFMERGQVVYTGPTADLVDREDLVRAVFLDGARTAPSPVKTEELAAFAGSSSARRPAQPFDEPPGPPVDRVVLSGTGLRKNFGGVTAVDGVDLELFDGEVLGLIGPNGAGKTTVLELLSGHQASDGGRVTMFGNDISDWPAHKRAAAGLGRTFQSARLWPGLTVQESLTVAVAPRFHSPGAVASLLCLPTVSRAERRLARASDEVIDLLGLGDYRDQLTSDLSTGTRRLVELAILVAMQPSILLLDEPSAGIAQAEALAMAPLLRATKERLGCSVLLIEHDMALMRALADRVAAMDAGQVLVVGTPDDVFQHPQVVEAYLGSTTR